MNWKTARPLSRLRAGRTDWYRIDNLADQDVTSIYLYDEIGYFNVTASDFVRELSNVRSQEIQLHISSPGGDVFDGVAIYEALRNHRATVNVQIDSLAASIASVIAMAGDKIRIAKAGTMMVHDALSGQVGNAADMLKMADLLEKTSDTIAGIYAERTGSTVKAWRKVMRAETWYNSDEAVRAGLADEVSSGNGGVQQENSFDLTIFNYAGRAGAPAPAIENNLQTEVEPTIDLTGLFKSAVKEAVQ